MLTSSFTYQFCVDPVLIVTNLDCVIERAMPKCTKATWGSSGADGYFHTSFPVFRACFHHLPLTLSIAHPWAIKKELLICLRRSPLPVFWHSKAGIWWWPPADGNLSSALSPLKCPCLCLHSNQNLEWRGGEGGWTVGLSILVLLSPM